MYVEHVNPIANKTSDRDESKGREREWEREERRRERDGSTTRTVPMSYHSYRLGLYTVWYVTMH